MDGDQGTLPYCQQGSPSIRHPVRCTNRKAIYRTDTDYGGELQTLMTETFHIIDRQDIPVEYREAA